MLRFKVIDNDGVRVFCWFAEIIRHMWCSCTDRLPGRLYKNKTCQQRVVCNSFFFFSCYSWIWL